MTLNHDKTFAGIVLAAAGATALIGQAWASNADAGNVGPYAEHAAATAGIVHTGAPSLPAGDAVLAAPPALTIAATDMPANGAWGSPYGEADELALKNGADDLDANNLGDEGGLKAVAFETDIAPAPDNGFTMTGKVQHVDTTGHAVMLDNGQAYALAAQMPVDVIEVNRDVTLTFNFIDDTLKVTDIRAID